MFTQPNDETGNSHYNAPEILSEDGESKLYILLWLVSNTSKSLEISDLLVRRVLGTMTLFAL